MNREVPVRFSEGLVVRFRWATQLTSMNRRRDYFRDWDSLTFRTFTQWHVLGRSGPLRFQSAPAAPDPLLSVSSHPPDRQL